MAGHQREEDLSNTSAWPVEEFSWISFTTSLLLSSGCVCSWQKYVWVDFLPITEPDPIRSWKTPSDPALDACILEICIPDVLLLTFLQVFLKLRLITTYLWTLEGYFDDSAVPAGNRRLCDPVVKSGSCCGFDNQLDSMTFINAGIFKKHCQRHNGPRILSPKLELSLKNETNANSNLAF